MWCIPGSMRVTCDARGQSGYTQIHGPQFELGSTSQPKCRWARVGGVLAILFAAVLTLLSTGDKSSALVRQVAGKMLSLEAQAQIVGADIATSSSLLTSLRTEISRSKSKSISLFCFCVMRSTGEEPKLIKRQFLNGVGIFGCDSQNIYSDRKVLIGSPSLPQYTTTQIDINLHGATGGVGTRTASWLNTETFIRAWETVINENQFSNHDWVVKVDPDAVFFPDRLREHLSNAIQGDRNGAPPCLQHSCPLEWESTEGGYFCKATQACRPASLGSLPPSYCQDPCYIGKPPLYNLTNEPRNGVLPCVGIHSCPMEWNTGGGGYFCNSTGGCEPGGSGPFSDLSCPQQCYIGKPPWISSEKWPIPALYIRNCDMGFGFFGAVEVISRTGVVTFSMGKARCIEELHYEKWGEDLFMQKCLDLLGVDHVDDFGLLSDGYCGKPPSPCVSNSVVFHPFKADEVFQRCLEEALPKEEFAYK